MEIMTNWNKVAFIQKGWECPRCGRINAPWMPCCSCSSSRHEYTTDTKDNGGADMRGDGNETD